MKKKIYIWAPLLAVAIFLIGNLISGYRIERRSSDSLLGISRTLSHQLFFDGLDKGNIDIFVLPPQANIRLGHPDYKVSVRALYVSPRTDTDPLGFIHYHHRILLNFACHMWDKDRRFSVGLIGVLSSVDEQAYDLSQLIRTHGVHHADTVASVKGHARSYASDLESYDEHRVLMHAETISRNFSDSLFLSEPGNTNSERFSPRRSAR